MRRLGCDADAIVIAENERGEPLSVGRKTRIVPAAISRALWARDRGCRFPGCGRKRFVDAHHIRHWSNGGETRLENLMLLCSAHHRLVHEGGFRIEKDYRDRWFFRRPDGRAVPARGYRAADRIDDDAEAADEAVRAYLAGAGVVRPPAGGSVVREPVAVYRAEHAPAGGSAGGARPGAATYGRRNPPGGGIRPFRQPLGVVKVSIRTSVPGFSRARPPFERW